MIFIHFEMWLRGPNTFDAAVHFPMHQESIKYNLVLPAQQQHKDETESNLG